MVESKPKSINKKLCLKKIFFSDTKVDLYTAFFGLENLFDKKKLMSYPFDNQSPSNVIDQLCYFPILDVNDFDKENNNLRNKASRIAQNLKTLSW